MPRACPVDRSIEPKQKSSGSRSSSPKTRVLCTLARMRVENLRAHTHSSQTARHHHVFQGTYNASRITERERERELPRLRIPRTAAFFPPCPRALLALNMAQMSPVPSRYFYRARAPACLVFDKYIRNRSNGHVFSSLSNRCTREHEAERDRKCI